MIRSFLKFLAIVLVVGGAFLTATITVVDRIPYQETGYYAEMDRRLDSLRENFLVTGSDMPLNIGWSVVNITPERPVPLAGYGTRDPMLMEGIQDSSYVRTVIFRKGDQKVAFITADLLIVHPEVAAKVTALLPESWSKDELYYAATHTHSGQGGWAPGVAGTLFAGEYNPQRVEFLATAIVRSVTEAQTSLMAGAVGFAEASVDNLVRNRLVGEKGITDPWLKILKLKRDSLNGMISFFSAHATCLTHRSHHLSGDFPALLTHSLTEEPSIHFAAYAAGAVASMGPAVTGNEDRQKAEYMVYHLKDQIDLLELIGIPMGDVPTLSSFRLRLPTGDPCLKITANLALRPYLFRWIFGDYQPYISVLLLGNTVLLGMPGDFSGELAMPLYQKARAMERNLIITSFNGTYMGYIIRDDWYDLGKYEARTMSWYGPHAGSYLSEVALRVLEATENRTELISSRHPE